MSHTLEECPHQITEYLDECPDCGELSACICIGAIADDWAIYRGDFIYTFQWWKDGDKGEGYAETYREALDAIAHAILCNRDQVNDVSWSSSNPTGEIERV
jgi:hypothetical protein